MRAKEVLNAMLESLGFVAEIEEVEQEGHLLLQVHTENSEVLIGPGGATLNKLQLLLNRILLAQDESASRVQVDVGHYRETHQEDLAVNVLKIAEKVVESGQEIVLEPMNSYQRRIVHQALKGHPHVGTRSPSDEARLKRITLYLI